FSSMFVKARCARRKGRELKQLRQFPVSVCERKVTKRLSRSRYALARAGENAKAPESRCDSGAVSIWLVFELGAQATGWNTSLHPVACASGSHLRFCESHLQQLPRFLLTWGGATRFAGRDLRQAHQVQPAVGIAALGESFRHRAVEL